MNDIKKHPTYYEEQRTLSQLHLLDPKIFPDHSLYFIEYSQVLTSKYLRAKNSSNFLYEKLQIVMHLIKQAHPDVSLMFVIKKCVFVHIFLHLAAIKGDVDAKLANLGHQIATQIVHELIPKVADTQSTATKKKHVKRDSSLTRVYNAVRSLSASKEKSKSKISLQQGKQKGAIRQIMTKIMTPLAIYLLKISQDFETYSKLLIRQHSDNQMQTLKWKISNYLLQLSKISVELNRLGKYYQVDMMGPWVVINYTMSTDVAIYYDSLIINLNQRSQRWKDSISLAMKMTKISKNHKVQLQSILKDQKLLELKGQIQLAGQIKQNLFFLYYNIQTQKYAYIMQPPFGPGQKNVKMGPLQFIMDIYEQINIKTSVKELTKKDSNLNSSRSSLNTPRKTSMSSSVNLSSKLQKPTMVKHTSDRKPEKEKEQQTPKTTSTLNQSSRNPTRGNSFIQTVKQRTMGL